MSSETDRVTETRALRWRERAWLAVGLALLLVTVGGVIAYANAGRARPTGRCATLAERYGLTPCPPDPLPVEAVPVRNLDPAISAERARQIADAYLRSRALYYLAIAGNSDAFFHARVIHLPDVSPLMFDAEVRHIDDARTRHGRLVLQSRATLRDLRVVPLPEALRASLGTTVTPMADAVVVDVVGPEQQVIRVPGQPDQPVSTLAAGDSYQLLVGGVLLTAPGLPETFAELGQWECLDPDTEGACLS